MAWLPQDFALQKMGDIYSFILNVSVHLSNICMTWLAMLYQMIKHRQYMAVSHGVPRSQVLSPESREVTSSNLNHREHGSRDLTFHMGSQVLSHNYDMDAYVATLFGGEA